MPLIAIVETRDCGSGCYECSGHTFAQSITNWDSVSEAELAVLRKYYRSSYKGLGSSYWILERVPTALALTKVQKEVEAAKLEAQKEEARKKNLEAAKLAREKEKAKKIAEKERETFEKLRKKFEKE